VKYSFYLGIIAKQQQNMGGAKENKTVLKVVMVNNTYTNPVTSNKSKLNKHGFFENVAALSCMRHQF